MTEQPAPRGRRLGRRHAIGALAAVAGVGALAAVAAYRRLSGVPSDAAFRRGLELHREGRYDEAAAQFARDAERRPDDPMPLIMLGSSYANGRRFQKAIGAFSSAIELAPENPVPYLYRGQASLQLGQAAEARRDFAKALSISGGSGGVASAARTHLKAMNAQPDALAAAADAGQ